MKKKLKIKKNNCNSKKSDYGFNNFEVLCHKHYQEKVRKQNQEKFLKKCMK